MIALRRGAAIALLLLYPIAWSAPLARASVLPFFGGREISILSGLGALWESDVILFALVALLALVAPLAKTAALIAVQWDRAPRRLLHGVQLLGRLAMADVFLIALYIVVTKGVGVGRVEVAWGLYLFTALVLAGLVLAWAEERA